MIWDGEWEENGTNGRCECQGEVVKMWVAFGYFDSAGSKCFISWIFNHAKA